MARKRKKPAANTVIGHPSQRVTPLPRVSLQPLGLRRDGAGLGLLFVGVTLLYALSTSRTVMLEDDGLFISASVFAGVAHPPGYPLYVLLGWIAAHVPLGSIAWRVHTLSGVMGAVTCCCIAWLVLRRTGNRPAAYMAAIALAVTNVFWSQAIIADVYTTNAAVLFVALVLVQEAVARQSTRLWIASAVIYGLGLANHWPLLILGSPILLFYAMGANRDFWRRLPGLLVIAGLTAAILYTWMVWRSHQDVPINFLGPIESLGELIAYIRRDIYADVDNSATAGLTDKWLYVKYFLTQVLNQFTPVGAVVAGIGALVAYRGQWRFCFLGEASAFLTSSFFLIALLGFDYNPLYNAFFRPYPLFAYCVLALWSGYGLHALLQKAALKPQWITIGVYSVCGLILSTLCVLNGRTNYRPDDSFAVERIKVLFSMMDNNAVFVVRGDTYIPPIAYLHYVEGLRPDIRILEHRGLVFSDRLFDYSLFKSQREAIWAKFFETSKRPTYFLALEQFTKEGSYNDGFLKKLDPTTQPNTLSIRTNAKAKEYFKKLIAMPKTKDMWIILARNEMLEAYGNYIGFLRLLDKPDTNDFIADVIPLAENDYSSLMGMADTYNRYGDSEETSKIADALINKAKTIANN